MDGPRKEDSIFSIREWDDGPVVTLTIHAKYLNYDISDSLKVKLREAIQNCLDQGCRHLVLDLSRISIVDSCGVSLLIGVHNLVRDQQGFLYLTGITHFLQKIFRMMHLDQYFHVVSGEDEVLGMLPATSDHG